MLDEKRIVVVMPAYNAESTLRRTYDEIPHEYVDGVILVDDHSGDSTAALARDLGIHTIVHTENRGYGANQKTCYRAALREGADVVVMLHPDYQYSPRLITALATLITSGHYDVALGSRVLAGRPLRSGMPVYKYLANRLLTLIQNIAMNARVSEYHTGYRAFSREVLEQLPLEENSESFLFDNQVLAQCVYFGFRLGEISCPTRYLADSSSIGFGGSLIYGLGVLKTTWQFLVARHLGFAGVTSCFRGSGRRLL